MIFRVADAFTHRRKVKEMNLRKYSGLPILLSGLCISRKVKPCLSRPYIDK